MRVTVDLAVLADFLSQMLGERTEVAVHDMADLDQSLCIIRNAISGREVGAPATDMALRLLNEFQSGDGPSFRTNYPGKLVDGQRMRSSSLLICDERGKARAMVCLNSNDHELQRAVEVLQMHFRHDQDAHGEESSVHSVEGLGDDIISKVMAAYPSPAELGSQQKRAIVSELEHKGVFLVKGFIAKTAHLLLISEPTLYRYLKDAAHGDSAVTA
ncbi:helix-turn-helix transcriptional regulator [Craterilacuibacter sp.]|uniref:helix-turn-helix transcriptional regulator n=1 Tax=Craterilacuibacter sp. TaxID=2870909 RepID=UPI003F3ACCC4